MDGTPPFALPSSLPFGEHTPRRLFSERSPIPPFDSSPSPPKVNVVALEEEDQEGSRPRPSHVSSSSSSLQAPTDQTDSFSTTGTDVHAIRKTRSELVTPGLKPATSVNGRRPPGIPQPAGDSSESPQGDGTDSSLANGHAGGVGRPRAITWAGTAAAHPLSPPLDPSSSQGPSESPFYPPHHRSPSKRASSSSYHHQHNTHPLSGHQVDTLVASSRPRRRSRPPPLQMHLLSPSSSGSFRQPSLPRATLLDVQPTIRSSASSSPLRRQHDPDRTASSPHSLSSHQPHVLVPINDDNDGGSHLSISSPSSHRLLSPTRSNLGHANRPSSRSVSHHSVASSSGLLRRNSSSSSGFQIARESSINSRKGKEREREREEARERERKEKKALEKKERERERRYRERQQEQVGRNDFGLGGPSTSIPGIAPSVVGGGDMLGLAPGAKDRPLNQASLDDFFKETNLRAALRSVSTAMAATPPPPSPSQVPALPTASPQSTPRKAHPSESPILNGFPPTPTQTSFPLFRRQSTEDSLKSPTALRTRTMSSLGLVGSTSSSGLLAGKGGKEGGAEKLKKVFARGKPSTERVPESVLTEEEKDERLLAEFKAKIRRAEASLISHPRALAAAELYKSAMTHRYAVVFPALAAGEAPLSLLNVARWKEKTLEAQRRHRAYDQSRWSKSPTEADGWRSTESFGSPRAPIPSSIGSRNNSISFPGRPPLPGPNMSQSSFEDGSVSGNLRNYRFGGDASTRRTSRSSAGYGSPYQTAASLRKEKVFPWIVDPHDVSLFTSAEGQIDETLDLGLSRSVEDFHALHRVGSALPSVQEVLDGQTRDAESRLGSPYGSPRSERGPFVFGSPDRMSTGRRSASPLPQPNSRPSSPLSPNQQLHFPTNGLSPPRPPSMPRSSSYGRRSQLAPIITSPVDSSRPRMGSHSITSPLSMTPTIVNLTDRRGSLPDGSSTPSRHQTHKSLSGLPARGSLSLTPISAGLSPPSASSHGSGLSRNGRRVVPVNKQLQSYSERAKAKSKRLADGLESHSGEEYREENLSELDVAGARSTKSSSLSKRSISIDGFKDTEKHPHMSRVMLIKDQLSARISNSRSATPIGSDAEEGDGADGLKKGRLRDMGRKMRRKFAGGESDGDFMEPRSKGEEQEQLEYATESFNRELITTDDDTDVDVTFNRRKGWRVDREKLEEEMEMERMIGKEKLQFLASIRPNKYRTLDSTLLESKRTFLTLHNQLASYIQVTNDRFDIQLDTLPLDLSLLNFDELDQIHVSTIADLEAEDSLSPLRLGDEASNWNAPRPRFNTSLASTLRQRRRSSISTANVQSLASLIGHQAKAAKAKEADPSDAAVVVSIEDLETKLERVRSGWDVLGDRLRRVAGERERIVAKHKRLKDPVAALLAYRETRRLLLEPQVFTPVRILTSRSDAIFGLLLSFLIGTLAFLIKATYFVIVYLWRLVLLVLKPFVLGRALIVWFWGPILCPKGETSGARRLCHLAVVVGLGVMVVSAVVEWGVGGEGVE